MITSGVHCVLPIHTTHGHIEGFDWPNDKSLRDAWHYASAQVEPNYPMPAIRYETVITKTMVAVFNEANRYVPEYLYC